MDGLAYKVVDSQAAGLNRLGKMHFTHFQIDPAFSLLTTNENTRCLHNI